MCSAQSCKTIYYCGYIGTNAQVLSKRAFLYANLLIFMSDDPSMCISNHYLLS